MRSGSGSMASAPRPTSWRQGGRAFRGTRSACFHPAMEMRLRRNSPRRLGATWAGDSATRASPAPLGRRAHLRPGWRTRARRFARRPQRRHRRLRRHSHERHSFVSVSRSVAGTHDLLGRQSHPRRWPRIPGVGAPVPVHTTTEPFLLEAANEALARLRSGQLTGAACPCATTCGRSPTPLLNALLVE